MAIMDLFTSLQTIINERSAKKVRQSIHDGIFRANQVVDANKNLVDQVAIRQDAVEDQFDAVQRTATETADWGAEIVVASDGEPTLQKRLDRDKSELNLAKLDKATYDSTVAISTNLSSISTEELRTLSSSSDRLNLNVDVDLVISGEPLVFKNTTLRTDNGSKIVINDSSMIIEDLVDFQGFDVDAINSATKPNLIIRRAEDAVSGTIRRITLDNIYIEGHPDFTADAIEIQGSEKGMIGLMVRNLYTRDHDTIFTFTFSDSTKWTNANVFENVFSQRMKQMVKYSPYGPGHPAGTHFTSNLFRNVGGNGSSIYLRLAHDLGFNRYIDCFVYDLEIYNNKPELDRVGNIWGINNNPFLMQNPETPKQLVIRQNNVIKLGYFDNLKGAPLEAFLKLSFMKAGIGLECVIWLTRDVTGKLVVRSNKSASSGWYDFYTHTTPQGTLAVFMQYTGVGWVRPTYHERNDFTIDHQGGMKYTKAEIDAIGATELIEAVHDANIF